MSRYAQGTTVPVEQSRAEIERTLARYGADQFLYGWDRDQAVIAFRAHGRQIRFVLPLPDKNDAAFTQYTQGSRTFLRVDSAAQKLWEQACRQRWRALALVVKAKLEAVEAGISLFENEFMANIVLPDGRLFGEWASPQIEQAYLSGKMPALLLVAGVKQA